MNRTMSIWLDIHKRSNGVSKRKEDMNNVETLYKEYVERMETSRKKINQDIVNEIDRYLRINRILNISKIAICTLAVILILFLYL